MEMPDGSQKNVLDLFRLDGRRALVTGGSKGLGRVMAVALAEAGADIAISSRTLIECEETASEISKSTGRRVIAVQVDVSKDEEVTRAKQQIEAQLGPIDILINNAGINIRGPIEDVKETDFKTILEINVTGSFLCAKAFGPPMAERGWGRVINIGSIMSVISLAQRTSYATSKAAVLGMTRTLALEWATRGVTVNAICPGPFATEMNKQLLNDPVKYKDFVSRIPMGRWGELHEIAGLALFLASDASGFVTGSALFVDGGWTAQ